MIRAISPSSRYVVEGFVCKFWISLEPYIIDLSRFYKKIPKIISNLRFTRKSYVRPLRRPRRRQAPSAQGPLMTCGPLTADPVGAPGGDMVTAIAI